MRNPIANRPADAGTVVRTILPAALLVPLLWLGLPAAAGAQEEAEQPSSAEQSEPADQAGAAGETETEKPIPGGAEIPDEPPPADAMPQEAAEAADDQAEAAAGDAAPRPTRQVRPTSCVACHSSADWFGEEHLTRIVDGFEGGAHAAVGLGCHDCHGGDPDPDLGEDIDAAMDPGYGRNPYIGVPTPTEVPAFCGRCHSDPAFMRRYQPDPRVDQAEEYLTSQHGQLLFKQGDTKVATCIDCHGVHGILGPSNPQSTVYPTRVAETCRKCHGNPLYMEGYTTDDGHPLPVDQYARWIQSVHAAAMFEKEDLTAPTCNDCHGNHGARPPGIDSIAFVCGQCHGREAELYRGSPKQAGFQNHDTYVEGMGPGACANCHAEPEPQAEVTTISNFSECSTCHGNHAVVRPSVAMLSPLPDIPCAFCHEGSVPLIEIDDVPPEPERVRSHYREMRDGLLATAEEEGLEGEDLFNWMVDRALEIAPHRQAGGTETAEAAAEGAEPGDDLQGQDAGEETAEADGDAERAGLELPDELRPEFRRLFEKFRIGKTYFTYRDPATGEQVQAQVHRCSDCHAREPQMTDQPVGWETSATYLESMRELTALTARAERILLAARRGGVHTEEVSLAVDRAVDAQIQLEVLVHTFDASEGSQFLESHREGIEQAQTALDLAQEALEELEFRRTGLAISLVVILLVLVALGLKIRQLSV